MSYLISQYWLWLLFALALGLIVGWMTCSRQPRRWGLMPLALLVAAVLFLASFLRIVNGIPALWIESGLLMFTTYLAGCCLGCWLKGVMAPAIPVPAMAPARVSAPPVREAAVVVPPAKPAAPAAPKVEGEDLIAGKRPLGLLAPRGGKADDLKLVKGIGKQNEGRLHGLGIWHFDQIADWTSANVEWVGSYLAFPGRIEREGWVEQARELAAGVETEFARRVKRGAVSTSKDDGSLGQANVASMADDGFEGDRPANTLTAPRGGKPDDLKLINGIGRGIEDRLNKLGIWHFDQIAAMNDEELKFVSHWAGFPGRALRENWKSEAAILGKGGDTEHSRAVKAGKIPSSLDKPKDKG
jgi:predicted flap endonuclease-1-like 5' DNA nuclease